LTPYQTNQQYIDLHAPQDTLDLSEGSCIPTGLHHYSFESLQKQLELAYGFMN